MKKIIKILLLPSILLVAISSPAQQVNWSTFKNNNNHIVNINAGWDYGMVAGVGYGQKLNTKWPIMLNIEFSSPLGEKIFDDFKTRMGGQALAVTVNDFSASVKAFGIFRRYENEFVRLLNFGSEFSTNIGYYRPKWFAAGEFGFDKAIVTHVKNGDFMKNNYPDIQDGWYVPTGGNFFYGVTCGYTLKTNDLYAKAGKNIEQDLKSKGGMPVYVQLGINKSF